MPPIIKVGDQPVLVATSEFPYAKWDFTHFNPVQSRVIDFYDKETNGLVASSTSSGKAQPDDALILTSYGYTTIANIKVGDSVIGGDGKPTTVLGVYPQGVKKVFSVVFSDRTSTECCEDHLWAVRSRCQRAGNYPWNIVPLWEIRKNFRPNHLHIPRVQAVEFPNRDYPLHPYVMGLLLGDGSFGYSPKLTMCEKSVLDKFSELLPKGDRVVNDGSKRNPCDYRIVGDGVFCSVAYELNKMGLMGKKSYQKFIPWLYLFGSIEQRWDLIRGLMDSDGGKSFKGSPTFDITSKELAEGMAFLVRSMGGWTRMRLKTNVHYRYKGEKRSGRPVYRLTINVPENPFDASCKGASYHKVQRSQLRRIIDILPVGEKLCRCIKVANEDGLYITNDLIVTHNTVVAEMVFANEIRKHGGKGMFLVPLRALAQEKIDDWTDKNYHFADKKISVCTGDYRLTKERAKELNEADLIIMSTEMLNSRTRNMASENSDFLKQIKVLIIDEAHSLTSPGRGDHLEVGLMKFTKINPTAKIILLSATMPNVEEVAEWVSYSLTKRETFVLKSDYRPCPLNTHFESYYDGYTKYDDTENEKIAKALDIIEYYPDDKFLVFAHTKRTGEMMKQNLRSAGVVAEFHNANLQKKERVDLEKRFRTDPKFRVVVATSTLASGLNMPARRVIILGVYRGLAEVDNLDLIQMAGRAGRPRYDKFGDAYILLPESKMNDYKAKLKVPQRIESQLLSKVGEHHKTLAFHLVSEIHHGDIVTNDDVYNWYKRSLASFQNKSLDDSVVEKTMDLLKKCGAIYQEDDEWRTTTVGAVASLFYFSPFDVSDLKRNFGEIFANKTHDDDYWVSMALGNTDTQRLNIVSRVEKDEMSMYSTKVKSLLGAKYYNEAAVKAGFCYFQLLNGNNSNVLASFQRNLQFDYNRLSQVLITLDTMGAKWNRTNWFRDLEQRIANGIPGYLIDLCRIPNVGKVRARRLYDNDIKTVADLASLDPEKAKKLLNMKGVSLTAVLEEAKRLDAIG